MKRNLQLILGLFGAICMGIALVHIVFGPAAIPGASAVNATMDSEDRFYATMFLAFGAALVWCVRGVERKGTFVYLLSLTFFLGGLARILSILAVGLPDLLFILLTGVELVLPLVIAYLQFRVVRAAATAPATAAASASATVAPPPPSP